MGVFSNIMDKLGGNRRAERTAPPPGGKTARTSAPSGGKTARTSAPSGGKAARTSAPSDAKAARTAVPSGGEESAASAGTGAPAGTAAPPISEAAQAASTARAEPLADVDVMGKLEGLAAESGQKLNWKTSIVDLLKLLGLDSSLASRKELAIELGCPPEKMGDSAQMNMWLHKAVLQKLAQSGGNIPADLLH